MTMKNLGKRSEKLEITISERLKNLREDLIDNTATLERHRE